MRFFEIFKKNKRAEDKTMHNWEPEYMSADDITCFSVTFGDLPLVSISINRNTLRKKHFINGSRDGYITFPKGYFREKRIRLSRTQKRQLFDFLETLDFTQWKTSQDIFDKMLCPGFCIFSSFSCQFSNGVKFKCLKPPKQDFDKLIAMITSIRGAEYVPFVPERKKLRPQLPHTECWFCDSCNAAVPLCLDFCNNCGQKRP